MISWHYTTIIAQLSYKVNKYIKIGDLCRTVFVSSTARTHNLYTLHFVGRLHRVNHFVGPGKNWYIIYFKLCKINSHFRYEIQSITWINKYPDILVLSNIAKDRRSLKDIFLLLKDKFYKMLVILKYNKNLIWHTFRRMNDQQTTYLIHLKLPNMIFFSHKLFIKGIKYFDFDIFIYLEYFPVFSFIELFFSKMFKYS